VLADNASIPNLYAKLEQWLGADRLVFVDEQPGDPLGHINHFRFIAPEKVLVDVSILMNEGGGIYCKYKRNPGYFLWE
jgi:hypothetical protein